MECKVVKWLGEEDVATIRIEPDWNVKLTRDEKLEELEKIRIEPDWNVKCRMFDPIRSGSALE